MLAKFEYYNVGRMTTQKYEELSAIVAPYITKSSRKRDEVWPSERLRYLTTGDAQQTISLS